MSWLGTREAVAKIAPVPELAVSIRRCLAELASLSVQMDRQGVKQLYHSNNSSGYIDIFHPSSGLTVTFTTEQKF